MDTKNWKGNKLSKLVPVYDSKRKRYVLLPSGLTETTLVDIQFRNGVISKAALAKNFGWMHADIFDKPSDIVKYRVV